MRARKIFSIAIVSMASVVLIYAALVGAWAFMSSRGVQQNFAPPEGRTVPSPKGDTVIISHSKGSSSFLYRTTTSGTQEVRLTSASSGIESEPSFSHDGRFVVYTFASSEDAGSSICLLDLNGGAEHVVSPKEEDALHPVFSPDDSKIFYGVSTFTGHHSPIVRPARHDWDIFSIHVETGAANPGNSPTQITKRSFYDLRSLDAGADPVSAGGVKLLITTMGYPIGDLVEEFNLTASGRDKLFQPHVAGESKIGPSYGDARFTDDGMNILFLAATDTPGGTYDYNVYSMSDVTGSDIKQLTHLKGMTKDLRIVPGGKAAFMNGEATYILDPATQTVRPY